MHHFIAEVEVFLRRSNLKSMCGANLAPHVSKIKFRKQLSLHFKNYVLHNDTSRCILSKFFAPCRENMRVAYCNYKFTCKFDFSSKLDDFTIEKILTVTDF